MTYLIIAIVVLFLLVAGLCVLVDYLRKKNALLKKQSLSYQEAIKHLVAYAEKIEKIKNGKEELKKELENAKSEEDIYSIIARIVADNNKRVQ